MPGVSYESFAQELAAVRSRGDQVQLRAQQAMDGEALLPVALEELRVTEEEVRVQNEQLAEARQSVETQRAHCPLPGAVRGGPIQRPQADRRRPRGHQ